MNIDKEIENILNTFKGSGSYTTRGLCSGIVENIDEAKDGYIYVRIPEIHGTVNDRPTEQLPKTRLTMTWRAWVIAWNRPVLYENQAEIKASGNIKIDGTLEIKNNMNSRGMLSVGTQSACTRGGATSMMGYAGWGPDVNPINNKGGAAIEGGTAPDELKITDSGDIPKNTKISPLTSCDVHFRTDEYDKMNLIPKEYSLWPFNVLRKGKDLIRVGDVALVGFIDGFSTDPVLVDLLWLKPDE